MIAKNIKGKSFGGCVRYVMNEGCELLEAEGVFADSTESIIRSFAMQQHNRSEIKQPVGHIPLSFSPEDKERMTNDFMVQLAKEYMQEMGIGNTQYIIVRHHNTDNDHLHIVYNRIDNDLQLISVNHDYDRNVKVCKKLKDRHGLTYGVGKERVKREKLSSPDKVKYQIYDALKAVLTQCTSYQELEKRLAQSGISIQYKYRSGAIESPENIQGISFKNDNYSFKGSEIDRKFSHANLSKTLKQNMDDRLKYIFGTDVKPMEKKEVKQVTPPVASSKTQAQQQPAPQESRALEPPETQAQQTSAPPTPQIPETPKQPEQAIKMPPTPERPAEPTRPAQLPTPSTQRRLSIRGGEITAEQWEKLQSGGHIFVENMDMKDESSGKFSSYVFLDDEKKKVFYCFDDPDKFVKYGKWEMRLRDKILIEEGYIARAKIKYWGGGFAHPYLWKPGAVDEKATEIDIIDSLVSGSDYRGSWEDPRVSKEQRQHETEEFDKRLRQIGKNRGPKISQ